MVNKVAALGALVCIVAAALSTGLLLTDEFVEVFVALGNGETSCAIGFLGVNEAGFDASCLSAEELEISSLGSVDPDGNKVLSIEAFTAPTEEFKLLFPTQEGFFEEINPFFDGAKECDEANPTPAPLCPPGTFEFLFPTFTGNCDTHYAALFTGQVAAFTNGQATVNGILAELFGQLPVSTIVGAIYDQSTFAGLVSVLSSTTQGGVDALIASPLFPFPFSATETFDQLNATDSALFLGTFASAGVGAIIAGDNSTDQIVSMAGRMAAFAAANGNCPEGVDLTSCFVSALGADLPNVTGTNYATFTYPAAYCEIVTSTNSPCAFSTLSPPVISALLQLIDATDEEEVETLALLTELLGGWNGAAQIASLGFSGDVTIINDVGAQVTVNIATPTGDVATATSTLLWVGLIDSYLLTRTNTFEYPTLKEDAFEYCTFLQAIGLYGSVAQTTCSFQFFVEQAADAAFAGGVDADTISLALSLSTLFGTCFDFIDNVPGAFTNPNQCWSFFPASLLNLAFSGGLQDDLLEFQLAGGGENVFTAAAEACNDDIADLEAIESAQAISPVGIVFLGAAAVFAVVSVAVNNKVIAGVAGGVSLLGTLLILIALITVYNAPIYSSVGDADDATRGDIIYLSGQTVSLGLGAIAMGAIGGVIMIVSVFTFSASDSAEAKALGAAAEKPVSI